MHLNMIIGFISYPLSVVNYSALPFVPSVMFMDLLESRFSWELSELEVRKIVSA
jgi:hypothetical protein